MGIKDAQSVILYGDSGEDMQAVEEELRKGKIPFKRESWQGDLPINITLSGTQKGYPLNGGAHMYFTLPVLEVKFRPGEILILGGREKILGGIKSDR